MGHPAGMNGKSYRREEIIEILHIDDGFLRSLESEEIICVSSNGLYSEEEMDRIRLVCSLVNDLDVNLAGVEVILHMRETMISMQEQFRTVLEEIASRIPRP